MTEFREAIGHDYIGTAGMVECASIAVLTHRLRQHERHTPAERKAIKLAEGDMLRAARRLRVVGNNMTVHDPGADK